MRQLTFPPHVEVSKQRGGKGFGPILPFRIDVAPKPIFFGRSRILRRGMAIQEEARTSTGTVLYTHKPPEDKFEAE